MRGADPLRIYCKLVEGIPHHNKTYNLLFLFFVDKHKYRGQKLVEMDEAAKRQVKRIKEFDTLEDVESYLQERQALDENDLTQLVEQGTDAFG